jgi:hypothetical protein
MASDVIPFRARRSAVFPFACQAKIIGALPPNMVVAEMLIKKLGCKGYECTGFPLALVLLAATGVVVVHARDREWDHVITDHSLGTWHLLGDNLY